MSKSGLRVLREYEQDYWETIASARDFVPDDVLPDFMTAVRQVIICSCTDGYLILRYPRREGTEFIVTRRSLTTWRELLHEQKLFDQGGRESTRRLTLKAKDPAKLRGHNLTIGGIVLRQGGLILRPLFLSATVVFDDPGDSFANARGTAQHDIRTLLSAANLGIPVLEDLGATHDCVITRLQELLAEYEERLTTAQREEDLQVFLTENPFILHPWGNIHPKYKLGREYVTDFLIEDRLSPDFRHVFVEIEPVSTPLFRKGKRDLTEFRARVHHGLRQLTDWEIWIRDHIGELRQEFPDFDQPAFELVIGRDIALSKAQRRVILNSNAAVRNRTILTYDDLARRLEAFIESLKNMTPDTA